jgi:hypothetical protein
MLSMLLLSVTLALPAAENLPAPVDSVSPVEAPAPAVTPPPPGNVAKRLQRAKSRPWWSWTGIVVGLAASAVAAVVFVVGAGTQVGAIYFWIDQTETNRRQAEREFATRRARWVQWTALGLMGVGAASFFGGLIFATYALGLGNPDAQSVDDL